jgi:hypothetical protein
MMSGNPFRIARAGGRLVQALGLAALLALLGCGGEKLVPVEGKATVDGDPLPGGSLIFVPVEGRGKGSIQGNIDQNGRFKMMTNGKPGVPVGKYKVAYGEPPPEGATADPSATPTEPKPAPKKKRERVVDPKYDSFDKTDLTIEVLPMPPVGGYKLEFAP